MKIKPVSNRHIGCQIKDWLKCCCLAVMLKGSTVWRCLVGFSWLDGCEFYMGENPEICMPTINLAFSHMHAHNSVLYVDVKGRLS